MPGDGLNASVKPYGLGTVINPTVIPRSYHFLLAELRKQNFDFLALHNYLPVWYQHLQSRIDWSTYQQE